MTTDRERIYEVDEGALWVAFFVWIILIVGVLVIAATQGIAPFLLVVAMALLCQFRAKIRRRR